MATQDTDEFNKRSIRRTAVEELKDMGFSWIEEEVRVKPPDRERGYILSAVVYRSGADGEKEPYVIVDVKKNPGSWARDQMLPYARNLDAPYIYITNGSKHFWYRTDEPENRLEHPPDPPNPGSGARIISGPEEIDEIHTFFRRSMDWDSEVLDAAFFASLLLKYAHETSRLEFDPSSKASLKKTLSYRRLPEFLTKHRVRLRNKWDRIWTYLNSYSFSGAFHWSALPGWLNETGGGVRLGEENRPLMDSVSFEFLRDVACSTDGKRVATIEYTLGELGLSIAERRMGRVTVFEPLQPFEELLRTLAWVEELDDPGQLEVAGTDPVNANIFSQFTSEFDQFLLVSPNIEDKNDLNEDHFELSGNRTDAFYVEAALEMLKPGGQLIAVLPELLLSGKRNKQVRDLIRERAVIEASISAPFLDDFHHSRRSLALLIVRKRTGAGDQQGNVFMGMVDDQDAHEDELTELKDELLSFLDDE